MKCNKIRCVMYCAFACYGITLWTPTKKRKREHKRYALISTAHILVGVHISISEMQTLSNRSYYYSYVFFFFFVEIFSSSTSYPLSSHFVNVKKNAGLKSRNRDLVIIKKYAVIRSDYTIRSSLFTTSNLVVVVVVAA